MVTGEAYQWDETICGMIACQHPPCWEAVQRVEKGQPRVLLRTFAASPERASPEDEGELPTLKIVNLPLDYSPRERIRYEESVNSLSKAISNMKETKRCFSNSTEALLPPLSVLSCEGNPFPGLNSRMESRTPHYTPISFTSMRQAEKIQVADLGEFEPRLNCEPACGNLVVRWVPDLRHRLLQPDKLTMRVGTPTREVSVKDLALESILCFKEKKEPKKKSNKIPTGGQPYLLHLRRYQKAPASASSSPTGKERSQQKSPNKKGQNSLHHLQLAPIVPPQSDSSPSLGNRRGASTDNKEKLAAPFIVQKAPSLHRFEVKKEGIGLRRTQSKLKVALGDSVILRRVTPDVEQLDNVDLAPQALEACTQCAGGGDLADKIRLFQKASAELQAEGSPQTSQGTSARKKTSVKFVEFKSNRTHLSIEGCGNSVRRLSKSESKYNQYCLHLANRKEAALAQGDPSAGSQEQWLEEGAQKLQESVVSPNPPPPPPSPLFSEISDIPCVDLT